MISSVKHYPKCILIEVSHSPLSLACLVDKQCDYFLIYPFNVSFREKKHENVLFLLSYAKYTKK